MDSNSSPWPNGDLRNGVKRRTVITGMVMGTVASVGLTGSASARAKNAPERERVDSTQLTLVQLPALSETEPHSDGFGINDRGTIVGGSSTGTEFHAVRWPDHDSIEDVGTLREDDEGNSRANAISNRGTIVGEADVSQDVTRAFRWSEQDGMEGLGTLSGEEDEDSTALDVNNRGTIVGIAGNRAFRWTKNHGMEDLGTLQEDGSGFSQANGIADDGTIVGLSTTDDAEERAFVWTKQDGMEQLDGLDSGQVSIAEDVNPRGTIVGESLPGVNPHPVVWDDGDVTALELLQPYDQGEGGEAVSINNTGTIVGHSDADIDAEPPTHAVRWTDEGAVDLGSLDGENEDSYARDVNERGDIVGSSGFSSEEPWIDASRAAVVWTM